MRRLFATKAEVMLAARSVSPLVIVAVLAADLAWTLLVWAWIFPTGAPANIAQTTHGVITFTLATSAPAVAITFAIACGLGRLRLRDLGLSRRGVVVGALATLGAWALAQLVIVIRAVVAGDPLIHSPFELGQLLGQILGNALDEEVVWRGFLCVQLVLVARRFTRPRTAWVVGLGVAAILFSLSHLPNRWVKEDEHGGLLVADLAWLVLSGLMFTFMYIRTGHLEVAIGFHALWNVPLPVIAAPLVDHGAIFAVTVVLLIVWPYAEVRVRGHIHL